MEKTKQKKTKKKQKMMKTIAIAMCVALCAHVCAAGAPSPPVDSSFYIDFGLQVATLAGKQTGIETVQSQGWLSLALGSEVVKSIFVQPGKVLPTSVTTYVSVNSPVGFEVNSTGTCFKFPFSFPNTTVNSCKPSGAAVYAAQLADSYTCTASSSVSEVTVHGYLNSIGRQLGQIQHITTDNVVMIQVISFNSIAPALVEPAFFEPPASCNDAEFIEQSVHSQSYLSMSAHLF
jgi:hypothetical protein